MTVITTGPGDGTFDPGTDLGAALVDLEMSPAPDPPAVPSTLTVPSDVVFLYRNSEVYPDPTFTDGQLVPPWEPTSVTRGPWGTFRVLVNGVDVSEFRGGLVQIASYSFAEPFGDGPANISFSAFVPRDTLAAGNPTDFVTTGNAIDIVRLDNVGGTHLMWSGEIIGYDVSQDGDTWTWAVDCTGVLWLADYQMHKPPTMLDPTDIGTLIPRYLNKVVARRFPAIPGVTTNIKTIQRGSTDNSVLQWVQELLSTATTSDGLNQWTVMPTSTRRNYSMRLKDRTTENWTVQSGQPGVQIELQLDATQAPNCIYGFGVRQDGYAWANWFYPLANNAPYLVYPLSTSPLVVMTVGTTDADTISGTGVTDLQRRINETGIARVSEDGVYNTSDADAVERVQAHYGILVDGIVGPQTWAALFPQYASNALQGAFRLPIAFDTKIMPRLYRADGSDAGANTAFDPTILRVETDINYGAQITKAEATKFAKQQLKRDYPAGWTGTITLTMDPNQASMFEMRAGQNIRVRGFGSAAGVLLHIAGVEVSPQDETVTLTVDSKLRDLTTLNQIRERNRENATNPLRLNPKITRRTKVQQDMIVPYDGESAGGILKKTAMINGLWVYVDVPVSEIGQIAKIVLTASPAQKFSVAFFGNLSVTSNMMVDRVGDPLANRGDGFGPYDQLEELYPAMGFIEAFGGPGQAAGYGSGYETSPYTGTSTTITGKLVNTAGWSYVSTRPPFVRCFFWSTENGSISGRLFPAPLEQQ